MTEVSLYKKNRLIRSVFETILVIIQQRGLLFSMARRDLRARYRNTVLGWVWSLVRPLVTLLVYMIVVGKILGTSKGIQDFGLFVFSGFLAYQIFVNTSLVAMRSVVENSELVKRISFPRIFLPISAAVVALTDAMLNFAVLFVGYVYYGSWPSLLQLKYLPLAFCIAYSFGLAVGIWGAVLNTKLRDLGQLFEVLVNLGIWLTPIFYSYTFVARAFKEDTLLLNLYLYNPMVNAVLAFQKALWPPASLVDVSIELFPGRMDVRLATLTVLGVLTLMISLGFFTSKANRFSEQL